MSEPLDFPSGDTVIHENGESGESSSHQQENNGPSEDQLFLTDAEREPGTTSGSDSSDSGSSGGGGLNPAWNPLLEKLPAGFRSIIEDDLRAYDQNYNNSLSKYDRYKPFADMPDDHVNAAFQIMQQVQSQEGARQLRDRLNQVLGDNPPAAPANNAPVDDPDDFRKAVQQQTNTKQQSSMPFADVDPTDLTPDQKEIQRLYQQQEQFVQMQQQREQEAQQRYEQQEQERHRKIVDQQWDELVKTDPSLASDQIRSTDLLNRAQILASQGVTGNVLAQAHLEQRRYNDHMRALAGGFNTQQRRANEPLHVNPTGSNPGAFGNPAERDEAARIQAFREALARQQANS